MSGIVIIGAGLTGLSCAYHLNNDNYLLLEKENKVGGLCRSELSQGFIFDYTGHLLHLHNPYTQKLIAQLLPENLIKHNRSAWIYSQSTYTRYPFQANTFGLPKKVIWECLSEIIKAQCDFSNNKEVRSFYEWILKNFGSGIAHYFMVPYNQKVWTVHPRQLTCEWLSNFVVRPNIAEVIWGAFSDNRQPFGYNAVFFYPQYGGAEVLARKMAQKIKNILPNTAVTQIDAQKKFLIVNSKEKIAYQKIVSTIPLPELVNILTDLPADVRQAAKKLRWSSVLNINLGVARPNISDKHWIYFPEEKFIFYRVGFSSNFSPELCPPKTTAIYTEVPYRYKDKLNRKKIVNLVISGLQAAGVLKRDDRIITTQILDIPYAYVTYNFQRTEAVELIQKYLQSLGIYSIGRYGAWNYSYMEEAILEGKQTAEELAKE